MVTYVKDGGTWLEINQIYVHDGTSFTNLTITNGYANDSGTWREVFTLFNTTSYSTSTGSVAVPDQANALHMQYAVGGGGGGMGGTDYDKAGGESTGSSGGSGAYVSDKVWTVTGGETLTVTAGSAGSAGAVSYSGSAGSGTTTSISGSSTGTLFSLTGGTGASCAGGGVHGPLRSNTVGAAGAATISGTVLSTGTTTDGIDITTLNSGPVGSFNQSGAGAAGTGNGNCSGDNCNMAATAGATSYSGNVSGGTAGAAGNGGPYESGQVGGAGSRGSGGGGGGTEQGAPGGAGGAGEVRYRFMRIV